MTEYQRIEKCPCMRLDGNRIICEDSLKYNSKTTCQLHIIGYDENGFLTAVCGFDWSIIRMYSDGSFEHMGKIQTSLHDVLEEPDIVLKNTKVMTIKEISKTLGCNVIVREYIGRDKL